MNYYKGKINGSETIELRDAIKRFHQENNLLANGRVSSATIQKIEIVYIQNSF
ncbi:peptidoglycan-binding domain-containing protein [Flavobacterium sp.]|uniref:peptidoglycan-binding domain-containing protein n=1 Tax=Flavobacterium sp. TaxID=239 RepID=UPI003D6B8196